MWLIVFIKIRENLTVLKPDLYQNSMGSLLKYTMSFHRVSWKSVQLFLCNLVHKHTNKQTGVTT